MPENACQQWGRSQISTGLVKWYGRWMMVGRGNSAHPGNDAEEGERQRHLPRERDGLGKGWVGHWKPMEGLRSSVCCSCWPQRENERQSQKLPPVELSGTPAFSYPLLEKVIWGLGTRASQHILFLLKQNHCRSMMLQQKFMILEK